MGNYAPCCRGARRRIFPVALLAMGLFINILGGCDMTTESDMPEPGGNTIMPIDGDGDGYHPISEEFAEELSREYGQELLGGDCADGIDSPDAADRHPGADEICNGLDDNCDGEVDEGLDCAECHVNEDCPATDFCADGGTCETVPCAAEGECVIARVVDHVCVIEPVEDCCLDTPDCGETEECVDHTCEEVVCEAPDACTTAEVVDHVCVEEVIEDCCWTADEVEQCAFFCDPLAPLPEDRLCGCTIDSTPEEPGFCTTCVDADGDGFCVATETSCDNELDDDGDGLVDCDDLDDCEDDPACTATACTFTFDLDPDWDLEITGFNDHGGDGCEAVTGTVSADQLVLEYDGDPSGCFINVVFNDGAAYSPGCMEDGSSIPGVPDLDTNPDEDGDGIGDACAVETFGSPSFECDGSVGSVGMGPNLLGNGANFVPDSMPTP